MTNLLFLEETLKHIQARLFKKLAVIETLTAILGIAGMILAILENEFYLNDILYFDEKYDSNGVLISFTMRLKDVDESAFCTFLRAIILSSSVAAVVLTVIRYRYMLQYEKAVSKLGSTATLLSSGMYKYMLTECSYLLVHLPPRANTNFSTQERGYYLEYSADTVIAVIMTGRIYLLVRTFKYFSKWSNRKSIMILKENRLEPQGTLFAIKAELKVRPYIITPLIIAISLVLFGLSLRSAEITFMHASLMDWRPYSSGYWCILNTMTTLGYGDYSPYTDFGRVIAAISALWGVFLFSLMAVSLTNSSEFTKHQAKAFETLRENKSIKVLVKVSVDAIVAAMRLYLQKKNEMTTGKASRSKHLSTKTLKLLSVFERSILAFKACRKLFSTTDFTETFESLLKKIETKIYDPFRELKKGKKTYADILISFYLTDVIQKKMKGKVDELHRLYTKIYNKIQEFQNITVDSGGEDSGGSENNSSQSEATNEVEQQDILAKFPERFEASQIQMKEKTAQDYVKKLTASAVSAAVEIRKNPNVDIETYLTEIKRRENLIIDKIKRFSAGEVKPPTQLPESVEENPDLENESSNEEDVENESKTSVPSRNSVGKSNKISRFSQYKPKNKSPKISESHVEAILPDLKKFEEPLITVKQNNVFDLGSKQLKSSVNDIKDKTAINKHEQISDAGDDRTHKRELGKILDQDEPIGLVKHYPSEFGVHNLQLKPPRDLEKESTSKVNELIEPPPYSSENTLGLNRTTSKDAEIDTPYKKNINSINSISLMIEESKQGAGSNVRRSIIKKRDSPIIQDNSLMRPSDYGTEDTSRVLLQDNLRIHTNPLIKGSKIVLSPQDNSSFPISQSRALQDFLSTNFAKTSSRKNPEDEKNLSLVDENPMSSERSLLPNYVNPNIPQNQQKSPNNKLSANPFPDSFSSNLHNLLKKSPEKQEAPDSWLLRQNDIVLAPIDEEIIPSRSENPYLSQLINPFWSEDNTFSKQKRQNIQAEDPFQSTKTQNKLSKPRRAMNQYIVGGNTPGNKLEMGSWEQTKTPTRSEIRSYFPNVNNNALNNFQPKTEKPPDQDSKFDPKKWAAAQLLGSSNKSKKDGASDSHDKILQGRVLYNQASSRIERNSYEDHRDNQDRIDFRKLLGLK